MRTALVLSIGAFATIAIAASACTLLQPRAGDPVPVCLMEGGAGSGGGYGYSGTSSVSAGRLQITALDADEVCAVPDAGVDGGAVLEPCEKCERTSCCATLVACANDALCTCADSQLDECKESYGDNASAAALAPCWTRFNGVGAIEKAQVDCLRASCKDACGLQ